MLLLSKKELKEISAGKSLYKCTGKALPEARRRLRESTPRDEIVEYVLEECACVFFDSDLDKAKEEATELVNNLADSVR